MSLRFVDKENRPCSLEVWFEKIRDMDYDPILYSDSQPEWEVVAFWMGVSSSLEAVRSPFGVVASRLRRDDDGKDRKDAVKGVHVDGEWFVDPESAILFAKEIAWRLHEER